MTVTPVCASPWSQVSSSSEPSSGSTCCSSPEWSSTPEQCTQSYSSEGERAPHASTPSRHLQCVLKMCVFCRSSERCRLSGPREHAHPDRHRGQHLCSGRRRGLFYGHSQVEPPSRRPIKVPQHSEITRRRRLKCPKFQLKVFFSFVNVSVLR